ncbi:MAG: nucleotidyltransferase domain-containing protein [Nanoarchaeota archaeon]
MNKTNTIFKEVLEKIEPEKEAIKFIEDSLQDFLKKINKNIKSSKIKAEIFIGGSFAKKTVIKKDYYDVDVFIRFDKKYKDKNLSELTFKLLKEIKNVSTIHGSRDYYRVKLSPDFFIEIIPVLKVKIPKEANNITDLSYSHVKYINKKIKSKKIINDIKIAKAFCHANNFYGAESYIGGFSGYSLELLVYYYKGFLKFLKETTKSKDKIIVDIEKHYKNKRIVLMDLNSSKLESPIILIDPTYKQRNALAALSNETFEKFKKISKDFLKNPTIKSFEIQKTNIEEIKSSAKKNKYDFILIESKTNKQEGDVAGSKLLKFYKHLTIEIEKYFEIKNQGFNYNHKQSARYFFVLKKKKEILCSGPNIKDKKNIKKFKSQHKKTFIKNKKIYAKEKIEFTINKFIRKWKVKNKKRIKEMYILDLKVLD